MKTSKKPKPRTIELVRSSYQPTKAEQEEEFTIEASLEEMTKALVPPVKIRWIDRPRDRRKP